MLPITASAASEDLGTGSPITFAEPNEDGYTFTPSETGLYTAMFATTVDNAVSFGNLQVYDTNGDELYGVRSIKGNWATYCRTLPLQQGKTYTIKCLQGWAESSQYTLSISKAVCPTLSSTPTRFSGLEYYYDNLFFQYTPTEAGWYTFSASPGVYLYTYDANFEGIDSGEARDLGLSLYLKSNQTYYLSASPDTSGTIAVSPASFPALTTARSTTIKLGEAFNYLTFTPTLSGSYTIKAETNNSYGVRYVYIFSDTQEYLAGEWDKEADYSAETTYNFSAGTTYYIGVHGADAKNGVVTATYNEAPAGLAQWTTLYPANGATDVGYSGNNPPKFQITFDREIAALASDQPWVANVDLTSEGAFAIYRASDDQLIYKSGKYTTYDHTITYTPEKSTLSISPTRTTSNNYEIKPETTYYITMGEGFVRFADGTTNPAILKGQWQFTTEHAPVIETADAKSYDGEFSFLSDLAKDAGMGDEEKTLTYTYHYDDNWFFKNSSTYQHELVQMSIRAAMAAFDSGIVLDRSKNIEALMHDLDFEYDKESDNSIHYPNPTNYSIGYAIGSKNIKAENGETCSLIMVAIRGGGYEAEWGGNFYIGSDGDHSGFGFAAAQVTDGLRKYITENQDKLLSVKKIWLVGYSRAAATANLVARDLNDGAINNINSQNVFAFCFECPQNTNNLYWSTRHSNIVNVVNPIDFVPKVAMSNWGYGRYGVTYVLPSKESTKKYTSLKKKMTEIYEDIFSYNNAKYPSMASIYTGERSGQASTLDDFMDNLAEEFISPTYYSQNHETNMMEIATRTLGKAGGVLTNPGAFLVELVDLGSLVKSHPINTTSTISLFTKGYAGYAHYPELCLSWIDSLQGNYGDTYASYRKVFINCPVDITVHDSTQQIVALIENNVPQEFEEGLVSYIDDDEQKVVILPADEEYTINLEATSAGTVTYTVTEHNMDSGKAEKVISYYEVDMVEGDTLSGLIENLNNVTATEYPLYVNDSTTPLKPDVAQSAAAVQEYAVNVSAIGNGTITGGGRYVSGEFAKVTAISNSGATFLGWYVNNIPISTDAEYRFLVDKDITIVAWFTDSPTPSTPSGSGSNTDDYSNAHSTYTINVSNVANGSLSVNPKSAYKGSTVTITAKPDSGYVLDALTATDTDGKDIKLTDKGSGKFIFVMPNSRVTIEATFQLIPEQDEAQIPQEPQAPWVNPFADVAANAWYYDAVKFASENGLMNGISSNLFAPDANLSRAQLAQILYNKEDKPTVSGGSTFTDVATDAWYSDAVTWAATNDIVVGYGNGLFGPDNNITREQLIVMLWRYAGEPAANAEVSFSDTNQISDFALAAIRWAVENGILAGKENHILDPKGCTTRAEVAQMLKNYLG